MACSEVIDQVGLECWSINPACSGSHKGYIKLDIILRPLYKILLVNDILSRALLVAIFLDELSQAVLPRSIKP